MRRHDSPGGRGAADGAAPDGAARAPSGGNGDLRLRLEALRASHPSSPDYGGRDAESWRAADELAGETGTESAAADEAAADAAAADAAAADAAAAEGDAGADDETGAEKAGPGDEARPDEPGLGGPRGPVPGSPGGHGRGLGPPGPLHSREPYRPWFSSGEPAEPWFTADPGDPPG
jgi:hypothetical protein